MNGADDHPVWPLRGLLGSPGAGDELGVCDVRVALGGGVDADQVRTDLSADLATDPARWLHELEPHVETTARGRTELTLVIPGPDVWTSTLTVMAVLRQLDYDVDGLHVEARAPGS